MALAGLPVKIRAFGHARADNGKAVRQRRAALPSQIALAEMMKVAA